jgi:hypothetical protein
MKNKTIKKDMDAPAQPTTKVEKNALSTSVWIWIGLIAIVCCIPLLNWVAVPLIAGLGILAFAIYSIVKMKNGGTATPVSPTSAVSNSIAHEDGSQGRKTPPSNLVGANAGLKTVNRGTRDEHLTKQG